MIFYELFKLHPKRLEADGEYVFESITVKSTEKRLDGFFRRADGDGINGFLEVQGYDDRMIYWRQLEEISTHYKQTKSGQPFVAIILFLDEKYDPKNCPVEKFTPPNRLIRLYLPECLKSVGDKASPLTVLKPLVFSEKKKLPETVPKWKSEIDSLKLSESTNKALIELLENAILSRFPKMTLKEIQKMIQLTPLEKTVAGQELIQIGIRQGWKEGVKDGLKDGLKEGVEKGKLIAKIHAAQQSLNRPRTSEKKLLQQTLSELRTTLRKLETGLKSRE